MFENHVYILPPTKYDSCRGIAGLHPSGHVVAEVIIEYWNRPEFVKPEHYHLCKACIRELLGDNIPAIGGMIEYLIENKHTEKMGKIIVKNCHTSLDWLNDFGQEMNPPKWID
jgi:hypothetical protein